MHKATHLQAVIVYSLPDLSMCMVSTLSLIIYIVDYLCFHELEYHVYLSGGFVHTYGKSFPEGNVTTVTKSAYSQYNPSQTTGVDDLSCRFEIPHKELSQHNTV